MTQQKKPLDVEEVLESLRKMLASGDTDDMFSLIEKLLLQMKAHNADLELRLMKLLREKFGRTSEKIDPAQLSLFLSVLASASSLPESAPEETPTIPSLPSKEKPTTRGHGRKPLPSHLPRRPFVIPLAAEDCACETCGKARRIFGYDSSELLDYEPGGFFVLEIKREKAVDDCTCAPKPLFATAPVADMVIPSGIPGPGLLAKIVTAKFADHQPLERQSGMYAREGVVIAPSTLCDWIATAAVLLLLIARRIEALALVAYVLWTDDTGLTVLDEKRAKGTKRGHMWVYVGDTRWAAFKYTPDWKAEGPLTFLANRVGYLVADGYAGYRTLYQGPHPVKVAEVGCWMHCRRYFKQALDAKDLRAAVAVEYIRRLYEVERLADKRNVDVDERLRLRQELSRPVYEKLGTWIRDLHGREPPKGKLGRALTYAVNHWRALGRFLDDGRLPLDNGESERALRKVALGRLNYLFAGSDAGAERAAIIYTVIGTCLLNGVNPFDYLRDVFAKVAAGWPESRLDELLPPNWAAAQKEAQEQAAAADQAGATTTT